MRGRPAFQGEVTRGREPTARKGWGRRPWPPAVTRVMCSRLRAARPHQTSQVVTLTVSSVNFQSPVGPVGTVRSTILGRSLGPRR